MRDTIHPYSQTYFVVGFIWVVIRMIIKVIKNDREDGLWDNFIDVLNSWVWWPISIYVTMRRWKLNDKGR